MSQIPEATVLVNDFDFEYVPSEDQPLQNFQQQLKQLVKKLSQELREVQAVTPSRPSMTMDLFEVLCDPQSELTRQAMLAGGKCMRFSLQQGDLSQRKHRVELFTKLVTYRPKNLWYSPVCAPWCMWNNFNSMRSLSTHQQIFEDRQSSLWQIALGIVMMRFQVHCNHHYTTTSNLRVRAC